MMNDECLLANPGKQTNKQKSGSPLNTKIKEFSFLIKWKEFNNEKYSNNQTISSKSIQTKNQLEILFEFLSKLIYN